jgi:uncharacterized protein with HEPN domain
MKTYVDRNAQRIYHILQQAVTIRRRIEGLTKDEFLSDINKTEATLYGLTVIGEAVRAMDDGFKTAHPDVPWQSVVGMRNFIVHEYDGIDYDIVWNVISHDLPEMTPRLVAIYNAFEFPDDFIPPPSPTEEGNLK